MLISLSCPCGAKLNAPDTAAGKKVKCPKCGDPITVPTTAGFEEVEDEDAPPVRSKRRIEDDEDDRPARSSRRRNDDEDEDDRPRKKKKRPAKSGGLCRFTVRPHGWPYEVFQNFGPSSFAGEPPRLFHTGEASRKLPAQA